jgi:hypothetical protein
MSDKLLIGAKEYIDFPELGKKNVIARIDSGAQSCSLHCHDHWVETMGGKKMLCAQLHKNPSKVTRFEHFSRKKVKSSNGISQQRYVVRLKTRLGKKVFNIDFTLSNRNRMTYPVLLGRNLLKKGFIIDVSFSYLLSPKPKRMVTKKGESKA